MEFTPFPKMPRLMRDIVVTEKIDGTNDFNCIYNAISLSSLKAYYFNFFGLHLFDFFSL